MTAAEQSMIILGIIITVGFVAFMIIMAIEWSANRHAYRAIIFGLKTDDESMQIREWKTIECSNSSFNHPEKLTFIYNGKEVKVNGVIGVSYPTVAYTTVSVDDTIRIDGYPINTLGSGGLLQIDLETMGLHVLKRLVVRKIRKAIKDRMAMENL